MPLAAHVLGLDGTGGLYPNIRNNDELVSNFVGAVRIEQHPDDDISKELGRRQSEVAAVELKEAQLCAEKSILEAKKFRARVEPPGNGLCTNLEGDMVANGSSLNMLNIGTGVSDDDFFHLTYHIDPNLIHKIEKGEFVELEKLLPKDKMGKSDESRLEWVQREGGTYLVPAQ